MAAPPLLPKSPAAYANQLVKAGGGFRTPFRAMARTLRRWAGGIAIPLGRGRAMRLASSVANLTITAGGNGYNVVPAVTIAAPPAGGVQATAVATVVGTVVTALTITNPGSGYLTAPAVTIAAALGAGPVNATATAQLSTGWGGPHPFPSA